MTDLISPAAQMELLEQLWREGDSPSAFPLAPLGRIQPLAGSDQDQRATTEHPLWELVRWYPALREHDSGPIRPLALPIGVEQTWMMRLFMVGCTREHLARQYTYSIPTPGDLEWLKETLDGRGVVEVGAGTGYWAWQAEQVGIDVAAYDPVPAGSDNPYCVGGPYTTVLRQDASAAARHPDRALMMVWPPLNNPAAAHALSVYEGDMLILIGEGRGGATADDAFFDLLAEEWTYMSFSPRHVTWHGIHCALEVYRR